MKTVVTHKTNKCLRLANPGQLELAVHSEVAEELGGVILEANDGRKLGEPGGEILRTAGLPMFVEPSQLQALPLLCA